ncbi:MAG: TetR family transcriptional regulator [Saprospiraceae bacterium]|nr:TetR family transcriptional regulator [Saprospiraceae bacterium]
MTINKTKKGRKTQEDIIAHAKAVFNRKGISITLNELADELGQGLSYITNHFRTKDHLFVAIAQAYEGQLAGLLMTYYAEPDISFLKIARLFSDIMDQQFEHRCAIIAILVATNNQKELFKQVTESYASNRSGIRRFAESLVAAGYLQPEILEDNAFEVFNFQFVNLFTTWMVNLELYDPGKGYACMKPIYLKGIFNTFNAYLTTTGKADFEALDFEAICRNAAG